ncbi:MAG: WG repeat-containing protein [Tannerellaceae bacterium]|nr:WG repeat-containing protein [Tannerellaceae bacterium]
MRHFLIFLFSLWSIPFLYGEEYRLVNRWGERVDDQVFKSYRVLSPDYPSLTVVQVGYKYALMDSTRTLLTEPVYDRVAAYGDWGLPVEREGAWGVLNIRGEEVILCLYDEIGSNSVEGFVDDYVAVSLNGKWGVLDTLNRVIVPVEYEKVSILPHIILVFNGADEIVICDKKDSLFPGLITGIFPLRNMLLLMDIQQERKETMFFSLRKGTRFLYPNMASWI